MKDIRSEEHLRMIIRNERHGAVKPRRLRHRTAKAVARHDYDGGARAGRCESRRENDGYACRAEEIRAERRD